MCFKDDQEHDDLPSDTGFGSLALVACGLTPLPKN